MRKRLQQCYERATELANREKPDFDYAHDLYSQCVVNDPGNLVYVSALLDNLQRKYKNNRKGSRIRGFGGRKAFNAAVAEEEWDDVFKEAMDLLHVNPWDITVLRGLALACAHNRYNEAELRYLKNALDAKPKDVEVNRHCAHSLARMGQFDMAISCWNRVAEKTKSDEAQKMMSELTMAKTMGVPVSADAIGNIVPRTPPRGGGDEAEESSSDVPSTDEDNAGVGEPVAEKREIELNQRQRLEQAIRKEPTDADNYFELAELHTANHRFSDAEKTLQQAIKAIGSSLKLEAAYEDAQIRSAKARIAVAEKRAQGTKTDESRQLANRLKDDLNRLELDIYQQRVRRYPEKKRLNYELGLRLRRAGNYREAIKEQDEARKDPQCLVAATLEMGECWQQLKQYAKSLKCYEAAIKASSDLDGDRQKMALYRGGILAAALKKNAEAKLWLSQLIAIDASFRDAASRLDKLG
jgi:tetratricopeptide (TPR) repeat protein